MKNNNVKRIVFLLIIGSIVIMQMHCTGSVKGYYVSQAGNDSNPGTKAKPFKTLQKLNSIQLKTGDKIYLKGKEIFEGTLSLTLKGVDEKPILITSYENENGNAVINGGNKDAIILRGSHFELRDINVKGSGRKTGNTANGITLAGASHGVVENIKTE